MKNIKVMVNIKEFVECSGLSYCKVRELCHVNGFPAMQSGRKWMIHKDEAIKWLAEYTKNFARGSDSVR